MKLFRLRGFVGGLLVSALACAGDGIGVDLGNGNGGGGISLSADVQPIFTGNCALSGCHAGATPVQGQNLSSGQAFSNIVNVQSNESSLLRVAPGDPDASYLVPFEYPLTGRLPTPVQAIKLVHCYEYQSCEHDGWETSEAHRFTTALLSSLEHSLPGYDDAPWEWVGDS